MEILKKIEDAVYEGMEDESAGLVEEAIKAGCKPQEVLDCMMEAMEKVGQEFEQEELYVPEVICSCYAMSNGAEVLKPLLQQEDQKASGVIVLGTVKGDMHDIGKNLVKMMFECRGLEVIDIGIDVERENFVRAAIENKADIVALSALLTTTMPEVPKVVKAFEEAGVREQFKLMVGGAPITQEFCEASGCDSFAKDAGGAAKLAVQICQEAHS